MNILHKIFRRIEHRCIIDVVDISLGVPADGGIPLTGFKYQCILCGRKFEHVTRNGLEQIAEGHPIDEVVRWMEERK